MEGSREVLIIEVYGTLTIKAGAVRYLKLGDQSLQNPVHTESIIDGELRFEGQSAQGPPFLQIERGGVTIKTTDGGGLIIGATPVGADPGEIRMC